MYEDPKKSLASDRIQRLRTKYSVGSAKKQAKEALGGIPNTLQAKKKQKQEPGIGEVADLYRLAYNENRQVMSDAVAKSSSLTNYSDLDTDYGEDSIAERPSEPEIKPRLPGDSGLLSFEELATKVQRDANDPEFKDSVERLAKDFNITTREIYSVINGENKDWSWTTTNKLGYKGLFQIGRTPAEEAGIDYETLTTLKPSEQVAEYRKYLERWGYDGSVPLAVMQAAPGKAKSLKGKPSSTVIYAKNSKEWKANPGWRSEGDGPITLGSLKGYYG